MNRSIIFSKAHKIAKANKYNSGTYAQRLSSALKATYLKARKEAASTNQKPSIQNAACKIAFEANGFDFYQMEKGFKNVSYVYRFMIVKYNSKSNKTQIVFFHNIMSAINYAFKKGYSSYNPFQISKTHYVFYKKAFHTEYHNGDRTKNATELKYTIN